jgi:hypothetical protein
MFRVGFEPTIPVFEQAKTIHALDREATIIGSYRYINIFNKYFKNHILYQRNMDERPSKQVKNLIKCSSHILAYLV